MTTPIAPRPNRSSRQLIEAAQRACLTDQPALAVLYLQRAAVARRFEKAEHLLDVARLHRRGLELKVFPFFRRPFETPAAAGFPPRPQPPAPTVRAQEAAA